MSMEWSMSIDIINEWKLLDIFETLLSSFTPQPKVTGKHWFSDLSHTVSNEPKYLLEVDFDQNDAPEWTTLHER